MHNQSTDDLLSRLDKFGVGPSASSPPSSEKSAARGDEDDRLNQLLQRITKLTGDPGVAKRALAASTNDAVPPPQQHDAPARPAAEQRADTPPSPDAQSAHATDDENAQGFVPIEPEKLEETGLTIGQVEALLLKYFLAVGTATGRDASAQIKLPFKMLDGFLTQMKQDQLVYYYADAPMNDYVYQLTDLGRERARRHSEIGSYFGAAPVSLKDYVAAAAAQSLTHLQPTVEDLRRAFKDLLINPRMLARLGPAINSGRGLFLFGPPGNGKTSIAERVTGVFGSSVWIPRTLGIEGEIVRLFDPMNHEEVPLEATPGLLHQHRIDMRWVRIRRPTIISGGELTMSNLEVTQNVSTGTCEAPLQLKSNCGTLVIDDFGRQKMPIDVLLNRWIVPLEKRYDFLNMPSGKKIEVPFDQLIIFSTNLEPKDLVDDAFLRRIPYKVEVTDPSQDEFRQLFQIMAPKLGVDFNEEAMTYLIEKHYQAVNRPFRCCQPRDLLMQIKNYCHFVKQPPAMTKEFLDFAVENYFAVM